MPAPLSSLALSLVLVASPLPQAGPLAPTGVVVARAGQVLRFDGSGTRQVLMTCEVRRRYKLVVPPYEERSESYPCRFSSLTSHEPSGRWAVGVAVQERGSTVFEDYLIDGTALAAPPKAGGDYFVLGDARGVTGTSPGAKAAWYTKGKVRGQVAEEFSADGKVLYFTAFRSGGEDRNAGPDTRWQLPFDGPGQPAKAPQAERTRVRARLQGVRDGVLVDGDAVYYYRPGKTFLQRMTDDVSLPQCDPAAPGTWRRRDLATGKDEEILRDGWCTAATAPFVGWRPTGDVVVLNQLGQDRVRRLYRYDKASRRTTPIPVEGLAKTPLAISADGAFVLASTYRDGLGMYETTTGALVWKAGTLPSSRHGDDFVAAFVRDGAVPLAHPDRAFLGDGRAIPVGPGDPSLTASDKLESFFERRQFGTAHVLSAGVRLAELSSMDAQEVAARIRSDVQGDRSGWSILAAWPASLEVGEIAVIPISEGFAGGACQPFATPGLRGGRLAFVDWREGRPQVAACATAGELRVRKNDVGGLELELDVTFDDGSRAQGFRLWLAPVR